MSAHRPAPTRVLVAGDANPDLVLTGDVVPRFGQVEQLLEAATLTIGGSAAITAHAIARLGRPVSLVAAVGPDHFGDRIVDDLARAGVDVSAIARRRDTATGVTVVLALPHDRAILTLPGAIPTLTAEEIRQAVSAGRDSGLTHLHLSSLFLQPGLVDTLPSLLAEVRALGLTTSLDTNDDPAGAWLGVADLLPHLDVLLPNEAEVIALAGEADAHRAARMLSSAGPLVVVKRGSAGAFAVTAGGDVVEVEASATTALDTTGAGDTFDAAFLDTWLDGVALQGCLRRAARAGAFAVGALGGVDGQPTSKDLDSPSDPRNTTYGADR